MAITGSVRSRKILGAVPGVPPEWQAVYQSARLLQLSPTEVGLMTQIRPGGARCVDLSYGNDLWVLKDPDGPELAGPFPVDRPEPYVRERDGRRFVLSMHWSKGAFVPLGAKRADGSPHPAAGTGFGGSTAVGYNPDFAVTSATVLEQLDRYTPQRGFENPLGAKALADDPHPVRLTRVHQYCYDGSAFRVTRVDPFRLEGFEAWTGHSGFGLRSGIPDGDDILFPLTVAGRGQPDSVCGVGRRVFRSGGWEVAAFTPVPGAGHSFEPTLERDGAGRLLFTCRAHNGRPEAHSIRAWVSEDGGGAWRLAVDVPGIRASSPVTINRAADGTPYVLGNPLVAGRSRDALAAWPLAPECDRLLPPVLLLDGVREFGLVQGQYGWYADHPVGAAVRCADGQWRGLYAHRLANRMEISYDLPPTARTGTYLGEVLRDGPVRPVWRF